jgi:hypothetical protein
VEPALAADAAFWLGVSLAPFWETTSNSSGQSLTGQAAERRALGMHSKVILAEVLEKSSLSLFLMYIIFNVCR